MVSREQVEVVPLKEKLRETRLRWFGYVNRMSINAPVKRCEAINLLHCRRGRARSNKSWNEVIRSDIKFMGLTDCIAQNRNLWRSKIKIFDNR